MKTALLTCITLSILAGVSFAAQMGFTPIPLTRSNTVPGENDYPNLEEISDYLNQIASEYNDICQLESAGQSVEGRNLWWMKITARPDLEEMEPEVHFIAAMHGNEALSTVLCLRLIDYLTASYQTDSRIARLVDTTEIWIMPIMNPDGYITHSRYNANGFDLNRNFPDPLLDETETMEGRQPETQAIMTWAASHTPTLAANFHTGCLVVNYPWDGDWDDNPETTYEACPDDALFRHLALTYASLNEPMYQGSFDQGITNGSDWYTITGGMQDWAYYFHGCNEVTIELSNTFVPDPELFDAYWEDNREAMLSFMEQAGIGVYGLVTESLTGMPLPATISVIGINHPVYTDPDIGDYHRLLLPGAYTISVSADGYLSTSRDIVITENEALRMDFQMVPDDQTAEQDSGARDNQGGCFIELSHLWTDTH